MTFKQNVKRLILLIIFLVEIIQEIKGQDECTTTLVTNGYCVKSDDCPSIKIIVDKPDKKRSDSLYISNSYCGKIIGKPRVIKVCCDVAEARTGCYLPDPSEKGNYKILGRVEPDADGRVQVGTHIRYTCTSIEPISNVDITSFCLNDGEWSDVKPCPLEKCPQLWSGTVDFHCSDSNGEEISCNSNMDHNTTVVPECKPGHLPKNGTELKTMRCKNGKWNYEQPICVAECGLENTEFRPLTLNGLKEDDRNSPWHVALYEKKNRSKSRFRYICGGTIIANEIVITAATCIEVNSKSIYAIVAGIVKNKLNSDEDTAQISIVKKYFHSPKYRTITLEDDMAVLMLKTKLNFGKFVHPACLIYPKEGVNPDPGALGKIAGWGLTEDGNNPPESKNLMVAHFSMIDVSQCYRYINESLHKYLTDSTVCAGYKDGTIVCNGDTGGGLVFPHFEGNVAKYYIKGILSSSLRTNSNSCKTDSYALFTDMDTNPLRYLETVMDAYFNSYKDFLIRYDLM